ncbi:unnamed protein product, partial [Medioppia subpectinata]
MSSIQRFFQTLGGLYILNKLIPTFGIISGIILIYMLFTPYYYITLLYFVFMYIDRDSPNRGGRPCYWLRNAVLFKHFADYFPMKLIKTHDLDPGQNYMFVCHPHGLMALSFIGHFLVQRTGFATIFKGLNSRFATIDMQFRFPFHREVAMMLGAIAASRRSIEWCLRSHSHQTRAPVPEMCCHYGRNADHSIHPLILSRTSPREMTGQELSDGELMSLFEAARWAPSFYNQQPWRFAYAKRNTDNYAKFESLVWPLNLQWCREASALVVVASHRLFYRKGDNTKELPNPTHSFDAGAACMALALEANAGDLVVHCMAGFDYERAYEMFAVDKERYNIDCMIAIGRRPEPHRRPPQPRISARNPLKVFVSEGGFRKGFVCILYAFCVLFVYHVLCRQLACNKASEKTADSMFGHMVGYGNNSRGFPETEVEMHKYCNSQLSDLKVLENYTKRCKKGLPKQFFAIMMYTTKANVNRMCKKGSRKGREFMSGAKCFNKATFELEKCHIVMIDHLLGVINADDKLKIPYTC